MYDHLQVKIVEKRFLRNGERLTVGKEEKSPDRHDVRRPINWTHDHCLRYENQNETALTADYSNLDYIRRDCSVRQTRKAMKWKHRDSCTDDEPFYCDQLKNEIDSRITVLRTVDCLFTDALDYRTYRLVNIDQT